MESVNQQRTSLHVYIKTKYDVETARLVRDHSKYLRKLPRYRTILFSTFAARRLECYQIVCGYSHLFTPKEDTALQRGLVGASYWSGLGSKTIRRPQPNYRGYLMNRTTAMQH